MDPNKFTNSEVEDAVVETFSAHHEKLTYSVAEAAALLEVSRPTIYRLMARRILIPIPGMRNKRIPKKQIRRLAQRASSAGFF
jgi:excisionase family DNA binding protein